MPHTAIHSHDPFGLVSRRLVRDSQESEVIIEQADESSLSASILCRGDFSIFSSSGAAYPPPEVQFSSAASSSFFPLSGLASFELSFTISSDDETFTTNNQALRFAPEQEVLSSVVQSNSHFSMRLRRDYEEIVESGRNSVTSHLCTGHSWIHQQFPLAWLVQIRERGAYFDVHVAFPAEFPFKSPVLFWPPPPQESCHENPDFTTGHSIKCLPVDMQHYPWSCTMLLYDWLLHTPRKAMGSVKRNT